MKLPNVVHPKRFTINGYTLAVATYFPVTDEQAARIALHSFRARRWLKKDIKKLHTVTWTGDQESLALL